MTNLAEAITQLQEAAQDHQAIADRCLHESLGYVPLGPGGPEDIRHQLASLWAMIRTYDRSTLFLLTRLKLADPHNESIDPAWALLYGDSS